MLDLIYRSNKHINGKRYNKIDKIRNYKRWSLKQHEIKGYDNKMKENMEIRNFFDMGAFKRHKYDINDKRSL